MRNEFNDWKNANNVKNAAWILAGIGAAAAGKKMYDNNAKRNKEMAKSMENMNAKMDRIEENSSKKRKWFWS